jgi:IMP dehydrogenase
MAEKRNKKKVSEETYYTFDDVLILPSYSDVMPSEVDVRTFFAKGYPLNIPLVSAAMDTVTESATAITMALEGGVGVIHRNMSIDRHVEEVKKVKKYAAGIIIEPITLRPHQKVREALKIMKEYSISGLPITDEKGVILGIVTSRDLRFVNPSQYDLPVSHFMTGRDKLITVSEKKVDLAKSKEILMEKKIEKIPVVDAKGVLKGLITNKDIEKAEKHPYAVKDKLGRLKVAAAVGVTKKEIERAHALVDAGVDALVIDTAHGDTKAVIDVLKYLKKKFDIPVVAGNVATPEGALSLIQAGADGVKVGIGPGSICTTRIVTGVGVPQLSAILNCSRICKKYRVPLIADGGIKYSGDIAKAIAAGADCVMIGNLFAGTDESPGETVLFHGRSYKEYRGMGSIEAMKKGASDRYFQEQEESKLVPEGITGRVPYRGPLSATIYQLIGGLKAGMSYVGARNIKEFQRKAQFIKITYSSLRESHVHDVIITKEAPNYWVEQ